MAKLPGALGADTLQANRRRQILTAVVEQRRFLRGADHPPRKRERLDPAMLIELAELRDRLLDHSSANPNAAHQGPIAMDLPVLLANRMAQVHAPFDPTKRRQKIAKVVTTPAIPPPQRSNHLIWLRRPMQNRQIQPQTAQVGLDLQPKFKVKRVAMR